MPYLDLNCDLGESFGAYTIGCDEQVIPYITSANIACGYHAGDPTVMHRSVELCCRYGVQVGAHPGLPDLAGFGRRRIQIAPAEAADCVAYQIGALRAFCDEVGVPLHHVKPHGASTTWRPRTDPWPMPSAGRCRKRPPGPSCWRCRAARWKRRARAIGLPVACEVLPTGATGRTARWCPGARRGR